MTSSQQDFSLYSYESGSVQFGPVTSDLNGSVYNLATVQNIGFRAQRDPDSALVINKTKTGGGIAFVTNGTDGLFAVSFAPMDLASLTGFYYYTAYIIDSTGNEEVVTEGRFQVKPKPVSTYSGDPNLSTRDAVRYWIADTSEPWKLTDSEIDYTLTLFTNPMLAAAQCARKLAAQYAAKPNKRVGDLSISWGDLARNYTSVADDLEAKANTMGVQVYSGGTSLSDKCIVGANTDRVQPKFQQGQFDNNSGINNTSNLDGPWPSDGS